MRSNLFKTYISSSKNVKKKQNLVCRSGFYGEKCSGVCSPNCTTCRHTDGYCECPAGLMGVNCSIGTFSNFVFIQTLNVCDVDG